MANIDKDQGRFKELQDHKVSFDQEKMWAEVKPKKKKKNRILIWFFGLIGLILISTFIFNSMKTKIYDSSTLNPVESLNINETIEKESNDTILVSSPIVSSDKILNNTDSQKLILEATENNKTTSQKISISKINKIKKEQQNSTVLGSNQGNINKVVTFEPTSSVASQADGRSNHDRLNAFPQNEIEVLTEAKAIENGSTTQEFLNNSILDPIQKLIITPFTIEEVVFPLKAIPNYKSLEKTNRHMFDFSAYFGLGLVSKSFSGSNDAYLIYRRSFEQELENLGAGLNVIYNINSSLYVTTGLGYNRNASKFYYQDSKVASIKDVEPIMLPDNVKGQQGIVKIVKSSTFYNEYHSINIPLSLGYRYVFNQSSIGVEAGINYYLLQKYNGHLANENLELVMLEEITKSLGNFGYSYGLVFSTKILEKRLSISPMMMRYPSNSFLGIEENTNAYSLRLAFHF